MKEINFINQTQSDLSTYRWLVTTGCMAAAILIIVTGCILPRLQLLRTFDSFQSDAQDPLISEYQSALQEKDALELRQQKRNRKAAITKRHITLLDYLAHLPADMFERLTINEDHYELEGKSASMDKLRAFMSSLKEKVRGHISINSLQHYKDHLAYALKIETATES